VHAVVVETDLQRLLGGGVGGVGLPVETTDERRTPRNERMGDVTLWHHDGVGVAHRHLGESE